MVHTKCTVYVDCDEPECIEWRHIEGESEKIVFSILGRLGWKFIEDKVYCKLHNRER